MNISEFCVKLIFEIQREYKNLLVLYFEQIKNIKNDESFREISLNFLDNLSVFWLERNSKYRYALENITNNHDCFILTSAISLDIKVKEQYPFKMLGEFQFLRDPFLKVDYMFRIPSKVVNENNAIELFNRILLETLQLFDEFPEDFIFFHDCGLGNSSFEDRMEIAKIAFNKFICEIFCDQISSPSEVVSKFSSFSQIESALTPVAKDWLIFTDPSDRNLSIKDRVERFSEKQKILNFHYLIKSEPSFFLNTVFCRFSQTIDGILLCIDLNCFPYLRDSVALNYFVLIGNSFRNDKNLYKLLERSIISYFIDKKLSSSKLLDLSYSKFKELNYIEQPFKKILNKIHAELPNESIFQISKIGNVVYEVLSNIALK